jgi:Met-zincin
VIIHTILHEMGHVLGLRHNFKGSIVGTLAAPSSSAMDYLFDEDGVLVQTPPSYDTAAIEFLYGLSPNPPTDPFCNDDGTLFDPDCTRFDTLADPLHGWWIPLYQSIIDPFLDGSSPFIPSGYTINSLLAYARAGATLQDRLDAFDGAFDPVTGLTPPTVNIPVRVDFWGNFLQKRLFLDPESARASQANSITNDPSLSNATIRAQILGELSGYLNNSNASMSYASRRNTVDILKKVQVTDAYAALVQARANIAGNAPPNDLLAQDLIKRIDAAINPYFR